MIPVALLEQNVDSATIATYVALRKFADYKTNGKCYPSDITAAKAAGMSTSTFKRRRNILREMGWIEWVSGKKEGESNLYKVNMIQNLEGSLTVTEGVAQADLPGSLTVTYKQDTIEQETISDLTVPVKKETNDDLQKALEKEKTRAASKAPSVPIPVSRTLEAGHSFPYEKGQMAVSVLWYWATERLNKRNIDTVITQAGAKKNIFRIQHIMKVIPEWEDLRKYIDWYMGLNEDFISKQLQWSSDYLFSDHCLNKYQARKSTVKPIMSEQDRGKVRGTWIKK